MQRHFSGKFLQAQKLLQGEQVQVLVDVANGACDRYDDLCLMTRETKAQEQIGQPKDNSRVRASFVQAAAISSRLLAAAS